MTNGNSQGIGSIIWLRDFVQSQQELNHLLDLILVRIPIPNNGLFNC
jgi:hypothetical protein